METWAWRLGQTYWADHLDLLSHTITAYSAPDRTLLGITISLVDAVPLPGLAAHVPRLIILATVLGAARPVGHGPATVDLTHLGGLAQRGLAHLETGAEGVTDELLALLRTRHLRFVDPGAA